MRAIVKENLDYLEQAVQLVGKLSDAVFVNNNLPPFNSGVGKHLRHILDFYTAFLSRSQGRINYDSRQRDARVETDRSATLAYIQGVCLKLSQVDNLDESVLSYNDEDASMHSEAHYRGSTIGRELQFLASHTVHHYAMIAQLLHSQGVKIPSTFGVAPSTLAHWAKTGTGPTA